MSLMQAAGGRVFACCVGFPCLGRPNGTHRKIERWTEHRSWVADIRWADVTINRTIVSAVGGGAREEMGLGGTRGGGSLLVVLGGELSDYNNENRECGNGFLWMGECNNQPKVSHYDTI
jgi:hypothetical protein